VNARGNKPGKNPVMWSKSFHLSSITGSSLMVGNCTAFSAVSFFGYSEVAKSLFVASTSAASLLELMLS
jgi:hypothetical protein